MSEAEFAVRRDPGTGPVRVIIADDHEAVRSGVAAILSTDPSIEIAGEAENGFDALAACVRDRPEVALIDLRMPGTDGIWATERITSETATRVLVLTTFDSDDLIAQALAAGAHGYLLKSTRGAELIQAVHHIAEHRHVLDPAVAGSVIARFAQHTETQRVSADGTAAAGTTSEVTAANPASGGTAAAQTVLDRSSLTDREAEVLDLLAEGLTNQAIANRLHIGITTVKTHVGSLYAKTGATSRVQLGRLRAG
ncbi:response regulator [Leucobacter sp. GX24907]